MILALAVVVVVGGAVYALVRARSDDPAAAAPDLYVSLCSAVAGLEAGNVDAAERLFTDRVHGPLHTLAAQTAAADRQAAARLLEAKQAVERSLPARSTELAGDLRSLAGRTRAALTVVGGTDVGPCGDRS